MEDTANCSFENMTYRETLKGGVEVPIQLTVANNKVVLKSTNEVWVPPDKGMNIGYVYQCWPLLCYSMKIILRAFPSLFSLFFHLVT